MHPDDNLHDFTFLINKVAASRPLYPIGVMLIDMYETTIKVYEKLPRQSLRNK